MNGSASEKALFPLFLVILIDSMGFGFLFPVLTPLFLSASPGFLPAGSGPESIHFFYGLAVAMYPLFMFFGAPLLGALSDKWGRKKVLAICLIGAGAGYLLSGAAVSLGSLALLLIGRAASGITAGTLPLAQAAVADVSRNEAKLAQYMGWMMFAIAGGQVLGPLIAGVLSGVSFSFPFYFAALLAAFNLYWLNTRFRETYKISPGRLDLLKTFRSYPEAVKNRPLFLLVSVFLCMQLDWSFFSQSSPAFLAQTFSYGHFALGIFSASLGLFIAIGGGVLTPRLALRMEPARAASLSLALLGLGSLVSVFFESQIVFWCATALAGLSAAAAFSFLVALVSGTVDANRQGWAMGITGAAIAVAWAATALSSGLFLNIGAGFSNLLGGGIGLAGSSLLYISSKRKKQP